MSPGERAAGARRAGRGMATAPYCCSHARSSPEDIPLPAVAAGPFCFGLGLRRQPQQRTSVPTCSMPPQQFTQHL